VPAELPATEVSPAGRASDETAAFTPGTAGPWAPTSSPGAAAHLPAGETVAGRFTILRFIAAGGMGEVYEARDEVLRTRVALKTILPHFADDSVALERFRREVILARKASHPNVCRIYDLYSTHSQSGEPLHFLTMEFLDGETLHQRLARQGRMSPAEVLPVLRQMAAALDAAHAAGVVHRDFKTSNVMLVSGETDGRSSSEMRAVVTDFGIARAMHPDASSYDNVTGAGLLGTPVSMAPEQVTGGEVGPPADIYALGLVLYEMLTGKTAFVGATPLEAAFKRVHERPAAPKTTVPGLPERWNAAVLRCLERDPARRFSTASEVEERVENPGSRMRRRQVFSAALVGLAAAVVSLALAAYFGGWFGLRHDEKWLRAEVIPELHRLVDRDQFLQAQLLAMKANAALPNNPALAAAWRTFASPVTIKTTPPGAHFSVRDYADPKAPWHELGVTPLSTWYPAAVFRFRFELEGYRPYEGAGDWYWYDPVDYPLDKVGTLAADVVHVPGGALGPGSMGHELELKDFLMDRYEVTNRRYKAFVAAGGYERAEFWREPFVRDGRRLSFEEAMGLFTDRTGRPGPSTWELSSFPVGQEDYPVSGVSWFEAAAFAAFEGRELPTLYHWLWAADVGELAPRWIVPTSNFANKGPAAVGQYQGIGPSGTFDMAGNVREWCLNRATGGAQGRFLLGGGWNDPDYSFVSKTAQSPWDRSQTNGMRLANYLGNDPNLEKAKEPVNQPFRDYWKEKPVTDAEFKIYRRMYAYDPAPLNAVIEKKESSNDWVRERVTFNAAYGKERVIAYLFLPKAGSPPFQTVVYFPGSGARFLSSIEEASTGWDFLVRSGRAFMFPVYRGTYERRGALKTDVEGGSVAYRDAVIQWRQDLGRSIDYLETRADIDTQKLGYFGFSWGGRLGGLMPAVEPRLKAAVLHVAGFGFERPLPEVDPFNFVSRITIPVLMLNGRLDPYFPLETSQRPMFEMLGTPATQKRQVIYEVGHFVPRDQLVKETLDWYDRYLGPVKDARKSSPAGKLP
jgi:dienelactone hydrolase/tRNA A-37 threonylcarbamoyl transferase component Bud32